MLLSLCTKVWFTSYESKEAMATATIGWKESEALNMQKGFEP